MKCHHPWGGVTIPESSGKGLAVCPRLKPLASSAEPHSFIRLTSSLGWQLVPGRYPDGTCVPCTGSLMGLGDVISQQLVESEVCGHTKLAGP